MTNQIFKTRSTAMVLGALCATAWAGAYPSIKIGLREFQIAGDDIWAKTLFAGIRFLLAGLAVLLAAKCMGRSLRIEKRENWLLLGVFGLVNTSLHYFCFYMGLSVLSGARSAILDAMGTFLLIVLSCFCFQDDHMSPSKVLGCVLGLGGVVLINIGGGTSLFANLSLMGDGMLFLSAVWTALGGLLTRVVTHRMDAIVATGISLSFGGGLLVVIGLVLGGRITAWSVPGLAILVVLVGISSVSFTIYNQLLSCNPVSSIAIFNALIPILGVLMCCAFLGEPFEVKYLVAGLIVAAGIYTVNRGK